MLQRRVIGPAAVVALSIAAIGCGSTESEGLSGAVEVAAGAPAAASDAGCVLDRSALAAAIEVFIALEGEPPTSEQDLVDAQMIAEPTDSYDVDVDGEIVAEPGSPCA